MTRARLAQSAERKALNLVVVGSSPTVGVFRELLAARQRCLPYGRKDSVFRSVALPRDIPTFCAGKITTRDFFHWRAHDAQAKIFSIIASDGGTRRNYSAACEAGTRAHDCAITAAPKKKRRRDATTARS